MPHASVQQTYNNSEYTIHFLIFYLIDSCLLQIRPQTRGEYLILSHPILAHLIVVALVEHLITLAIYRHYETAWVKAVQYLDDLPPEQDRYFKLLKPAEQDMLRKGTSPDEILQLLQTTAATKRSKLQWFSDNVAKPFSQFQGIFEATASACSGIGAPIWAPIKLILQASSPLIKINPC